jgi:hypothetical protein
MTSRRLDQGQVQVLLDRQTGDDAAVFGHQADAVARRLPGRHAVQWLAGEPYLSGLQLRIGESRDRAQA